MAVETRVRAARDLHRFLGSDHVTRGSGAMYAVLDDLRAVAGYDYGHICEWSNPADQHTMLAVRDMPVDQQRYWLENVHHEQAFLDIPPSAPILRAVEMPLSEKVDSALFEELFYRPGLVDALSMRLWASDGRFVGTVTASVAGSPFDELAIDLLEMLAPRLSRVLDPVPQLWPLSTDLADGHAEGLVVDGTGRVLSLTPAAEPELVRPGGPVRELVDSAAHGRPRAQSLVLVVGDRVLSVSLQPGRHGVLVLHRAIPTPFGLSLRELQILDALASGATNARLAARFGITRSTVATYVERLLVKTGCPNRTAAARLAARLHLTIS